MPPVVGRIRKQSTFRALSRPDGRARRGALSVVFRLGSPEVPEVADLPLFGFAVGRRYGGAVERNRLRRRLRHAARSSGPDLAAGAYLVRVASGAPPAYTTDSVPLRARPSGRDSARNVACFRIRPTTAGIVLLDAGGRRLTPSADDAP